MTALRVIPAVLSAVLLAAHFLRSGNLFVVAAILLSPLLLLIPSKRAVHVLQLVLVAGFIEWMRTSWVLMSVRDAAGLPWARMFAILGTVALVTLVSAVLLDVVARRRIVGSGRFIRRTAA